MNASTAEDLHEVDDEPEVEAREETRTLQIEVPRVFAPALAKSRYKALYGGRGGAKSHFFAREVIKRCLMLPGYRVVCLREVQNSLEQSVKRLLEDIIESYDLHGYFRILNTHIETRGGGIIIFKGMQSYNSDNIKSLEGYDLAWFEEAQTCSQRSLDLLRPTIRKDGSELWFSWNPRHATDPVDALFRGGEPPPESVVIESSYEDNPWLPKQLQLEIEYDQRRDPDKFAHVWRGKYEKFSHARIFRNWRVEPVPDPPRGQLILLGCDWGFATSPTAAPAAYFKERTLYVFHEVYKVGVEIEDTPDLLDTLFCDGQCPERIVQREPLRVSHDQCQRPTHGEARRWTAIADSARPETISHMNRHGYPKVRAAKKGPNSVEEGVKFLQSYDIVVDPRCKHTIDELTFYCYPIDEKTGLVIPQLPRIKNHVIDSLRYLAEPIREYAESAGLVF